MVSEYDSRVRNAAFDWLSKQVEIKGDVLSWHDLKLGFSYGSETIHLVSQQGIFKPKSLEIPLTIRTSDEGPYDDAFDERSGLLKYAFRGTDPEHRDNRGLRTAMLESIPLIYFHAVVPGKYLAAYPVFIVGESKTEKMFSVAVDDVKEFRSNTIASEQALPRREYVTRIYQQRLHQKGFRERVLSAYRRHCSICRLKHAELLDAAHIIPDSKPGGDPIVPNGISLCKIHHAAYDANVLGISPDYKVSIRKDVLVEIDGPMLKHGIVEMHGTKILLPRQLGLHPDRERLDIRFQEFRAF